MNCIPTNSMLQYELQNRTIVLKNKKLWNKILNQKWKIKCVQQIEFAWIEDEWFSTRQLFFSNFTGQETTVLSVLITTDVKCS